MRIMIAACTAAMLAAGGAQAGEQTLSAPANGGMSVGIGVICNTTEQAERFVALRAGGAAIAPAMTEVNQAAQDPRACGMAAIAFQRDKTVATQTLHGKLVSIVRVNVLAGFNGKEWRRVPEMVQYAVIEADGISI